MFMFRRHVADLGLRSKDELAKRRAWAAPRPARPGIRLELDKRKTVRSSTASQVDHLAPAPHRLVLRHRVGAGALLAIDPASGASWAVCRVSPRRFAIRPQSSDRPLPGFIG